MIEQNKNKRTSVCDQRLPQSQTNGGNITAQT